MIVNGYPAGDSAYNSLQAKVQKTLMSGISTLTTFTWGKIMTDDGNPPLGFVGSHNGSVQDWRNLRYEHSISPQDVKYQFTFSGFLRLAGWQRKACESERLRRMGLPVAGR